MCRNGQLTLVIVVTLLSGIPPLSAAAAWPVTAKVVVTTNYYPVTGATRFELLTSKANNRPWKATNAFDACTQWNIRWAFNCTQQAGRYVLGSVELTTAVAVNLPRWVPPPDARSNLVERWQEFVKALGTHELGHVTLARLATAALKEELEVTPTYISPDELAAAVERNGKAIFEKFRQKEAAYDRETRHGATQGVRFRR